MKRLWMLFVAVLVLVVFRALLDRNANLPGATAHSQGGANDRGQIGRHAGQIEAGQNVWQSMGGMELGSVWGHGSYVAPDWTADWLHREAMFILDHWATDGFGKPFDNLIPNAKPSSSAA